MCAACGRGVSGFPLPVLLCCCCNCAPTPFHGYVMRRYSREQRDITAPESLNLFLETRFEQLKTACELQMWAEAFRSVEDIQALITLGKRQPKQQMMATYYRCVGIVHERAGAPYTKALCCIHCLTTAVARVTTWP
jgi:hypothetical protein